MLKPTRLRTVFHRHLHDPQIQTWWIETLFLLVGLSVRWDMHALVHETWAYRIYNRAVMRRKARIYRAHATRMMHGVPKNKR